MVTRAAISRFVSGSALRMGAAGYLAAYYLMQASGLFGQTTGEVMRILHQWPALAGIAVLLAGSLSALIAWRKGTDRTSPSVLPLVIVHCGLLIAGAGIIVSSLTRFEGSLSLSEGQEGSASRGALDPATVYARVFSPWPDEQLTVLTVAPFFSEKLKPLVLRKAQVLCRESGDTGGRERSISSLLPSMIGGFAHRIVAVGYSPHVQLFDGSGKVIEDAYFVLDLHPPGSEDYFRLPQLPHTFTVRYYPDASLVPKKISAAEGKSGPLYQVIVARNLNMVANTTVSPYELIPVDAVALSLQETRRWVEIRIVNDPGYYLLVPGMIVAVCGGLVGAIIRRRGSRKESHAAPTAG